MKARVRSGCNGRSFRSIPSFHTYLKPGALAQMKYSKIAAKHKESDTQTQMALCQLKISQGALQQPPVGPHSMEGFPCFAFRFKTHFTRCIQRKKLIAVAPIFSESQS